MGSIISVKAKWHDHARANNNSKNRVQSWIRVASTQAGGEEPNCWQWFAWDENRRTPREWRWRHTTNQGMGAIARVENPGPMLAGLGAGSESNSQKWTSGCKGAGPVVPEALRGGPMAVSSGEDGGGGGGISGVFGLSPGNIRAVRRGPGDPRHTADEELEVVQRRPSPACRDEWYGRRGREVTLRSWTVCCESSKSLKYFSDFRNCR